MSSWLVVATLLYALPSPPVRPAPVLFYWNTRHARLGVEIRATPGIYVPCMMHRQGC